MPLFAIRNGTMSKLSNLFQKLKPKTGKPLAETGSMPEELTTRIKMDKKWEEMRFIAQKDLTQLMTAEKSYGNSWRRRGGTGAFMMLARKFDRIEQQSKSVNWDIFEACDKYTGEDGLLDDIGDLRRYLLLVEHFVRHGEEIIEPIEKDEDE